MNSNSLFSQARYTIGDCAILLLWLISLGLLANLQEIENSTILGLSKCVGFNSFLNQCMHTIETPLLTNVEKDYRRYRPMELTGHLYGVLSIKFSPDGKLLASGGDAGENAVVIWDVSNGKRIGILRGHSGGVQSLAFSPDNKILVSGAGMIDEGYNVGGEIFLWNLEEMKLIGELGKHGNRVSSLLFSSDGNTIYSGDWDGDIKIWDLKFRKVLANLRGHKMGVYSMCLNSDESILVTVGGESLNTKKAGEVKIWELRSYKMRELRGHRYFIDEVCLLEGGNSLATVASITQGASELKIWDTGTGKEMFHYEEKESSFRSVAFNPTKSRLVTTSTFYRPHSKRYQYDEISLWNKDHRGKEKTIRIHSGPIHTATISPNGRLFATCSAHQSTVRVWRLTDLMGH